MALLPPSVPSGTGKGVNELFTLLNPAIGSFDASGIFFVSAGNIPPISQMRVIWLDSIAKTFNDNPDKANNLYQIVNNSANEVKFHWTDIYALSMIADTVNGAALDYKYRSYKAGSRLFGEADLLKIYKNILAAPGARDYNSEVAGLIIQEANETEPAQNGGTQNGGSQNGGSQNGGIPSGSDNTGTSQDKKQKQWITYALIGLILFVIFKKKYKNGSKGKR